MVSRAVLKEALAMPTIRCSNMRGHGPHIWRTSRANGSEGRVCPGRTGGDV